MSTLTYLTTLTTLDCGSCGIPFAMPSDIHSMRLKDGGWFWCPNGHEIHYFEPENKKLEAKVARLTAMTDQAHAEASRQRNRAEHERRRAAAARGQVTKIKNRVGKGVCPCCNRHFVNVERHMASQHPDFNEPTT